MTRTSDYSETKAYKAIKITPTARARYQQYADDLDIAFGELLEQIARYPSVARGFAAFVDSQNKSSKAS